MLRNRLFPFPQKDFRRIFKTFKAFYFIFIMSMCILVLDEYVDTVVYKRLEEGKSSELEIQTAMVLGVGAEK